MLFGAFTIRCKCKNYADCESAKECVKSTSGRFFLHDRELKKLGVPEDMVISIEAVVNSSPNKQQ